MEFKKTKQYFKISKHQFIARMNRYNSVFRGDDVIVEKII